MNDNIIMEAVKNSKCADDIIVIACIRNFEEALFGHPVSTDKPYNALLEMKRSPNKRKVVEQLLKSLLDASEEPPENCKRRKIAEKSDNSQLKSQASVDIGEQLNLFGENSSD